MTGLQGQALTAAQFVAAHDDFSERVVGLKLEIARKVIGTRLLGGEEGFALVFFGHEAQGDLLQRLYFQSRIRLDGRALKGNAAVGARPISILGLQLRLSPDKSEEHTSELQSRPHLVCRLLLEK